MGLYGPLGVPKADFFYPGRVVNPPSPILKQKPGPNNPQWTKRDPNPWRSWVRPNGKIQVGIATFHSAKSANTQTKRRPTCEAQTNTYKEEANMPVRENDGNT